MESYDRRFSRSAFVKAAASAAAAALVPLGAAAAAPLGPLEKTTISMGLPTESTVDVPIYVAAAQTWKDVGLDVQVTAFRGEAEELQALAGGSIDISMQAFDGVISLVNAGQPVIGFYGGILQSDFAWLAQPNVKKWSDLKGGTMAVTAYGSLTEQLSRYALRKHGLVVGKDIQMQPAGGSAGQWAALKSGKVTSAILAAPFKWIAKDAGFTTLGTEAVDVIAPWPQDVLVAHRQFLDQNPNTVRAFLRGYVAAIRLARSNRDMAIGLINQHLKYDPQYALHAYSEVMAGFDERGSFPPQKTMDVFWKIKLENGDVTAPWANSRLMDMRFINAFSQWAP